MFAYTRTNHNSVLGIRQLAKSAGCSFASVSSHPLFSSLSAGNAHSTDHHSSSGPADSSKSMTQNQKLELVGDGNVAHLFALPAECNFSGAKADLACVGESLTMYVCVYVCVCVYMDI